MPEVKGSQVCGGLAVGYRAPAREPPNLSLSCLRSIIHQPGFLSGPLLAPAKKWGLWEEHALLRIQALEGHEEDVSEVLISLTKTGSPRAQALIFKLKSLA